MSIKHPSCRNPRHSYDTTLCCLVLHKQYPVLRLREAPGIAFLFPNTALLLRGLCTTCPPLELLVFPVLRPKHHDLLFFCKVCLFQCLASRNEEAFNGHQKNEYDIFGVLYSLLPEEIPTYVIMSHP